MFTGIVQGMGTLSAIEDKYNGVRTHVVTLPIEMANDLQIGASVANNGCCLTITEIKGQQVSFDLIDSTLALTNLGQLTVGSAINLERAAKFGDEIGGHLMSGHIMCTTTISRIDSEGDNRTIWFALNNAIRPYILDKGFVGLNGCSLTIAKVTDQEFNVHLIPETLSRTLFGTCQVGDAINVELDPQTQAIVDTVHRVLTKQQLA